MTSAAILPAGEQSLQVGSSKSGCGAVVLGGDHQGLGIVRSLGRHNIPVVVIDDQFSIARFSKYTTRAISVPDLRDEKRTVDTVLEIGRRLSLNGWVLYPTRDETVAAFARYRQILAEVFRVPTPDWSTTQWVWDKRKTYRLAGELNIPTPSTWYLSEVADLDRIGTEPPFVIKPAIKEHFFYDTKAKAWRANSRAELHAMFLQAAALVGQGEVIVQDLIPGDGSQQFAYCAFFKQGRAVGRMVVRRTRQHPLEFGRASTFVETIDLPQIIEPSERFLRAIDYYGLVELEYKLDARTGEYKLLDVNGRTWGYHTLGIGAGVDFPYMIFADQVGDPVAPCQGRVGVKWVRLLTDIPTGILEIAGRRQSLRSYLRSLRGVQVESMFCWEDLRPAIAEIAFLPYLSFKKGLMSSLLPPKPIDAQPRRHASGPKSMGNFGSRSISSESPRLDSKTQLRIREVDPIGDPAWSELVARHPRATIFHTRGWLEALKRTYGYEPLAFTTSSNTEAPSNGLVFCRVSSWLTGHRIVSVPFTDHCEPLVSSVEELGSILGALRDEREGHHWSYIEVRPAEFDLGSSPGLNLSKSFCLHRLDLRPSLDQLFRGFHKDCIRRKIRRAEREGLIHEEGRSQSLLERFYHLIVLTRRRQNVPPQPLSWFRNLVECLGDCLTFHIASRRGEPVAGILTLKHGTTLVYKYGCSDHRFNNLGGTQLIFWQAICEAKRDGLEELDMGRSEWTNRGLLRFKDRWGATRSVLTYWRFGGGSTALASAWNTHAVRWVLGHMPNGLLTTTGNLLYKHLG